MNLSKQVENKFQELFNEEPLLVRSPGRVNLIGEHTDYNMGFVLPGAIDKAIYFAISGRRDKNCKLYAINLDDSFEFTINNLQSSEKGWPNYLMGVVDQLCKHKYHFSGFNCVFGGNIPIGAGLSSSAAIEAGLAFALNHLFKLGIEDFYLIKLAQKAENDFVGVKCGIMDQFVNILGVDNKLLLIDCRSLDHQYVPFDYKNISIVLFNSGVSHSLASSEYNKRREECNIGVDIIKKTYSFVESLRDVSIVMLNEFKSKLDPVIYKRCKYVVEENERILQACSALEKREVKEFGKLMYETHEGLRKDYEVSCRELDYLVELTINHPQIYGARMMGGGFGGCTINLIENASVEQVSKTIIELYKQMFGIEAKAYVTSITGGTSIITVDQCAAV